MTTITGSARALVSKYTGLNPATPEKTPAHEFVFLAADRDIDCWTEDGYIEVGTAQITVELFPRDQTILSTVASLRAVQSKVRADAEAEATRLETQIQQFLAITNEVRA